MLGLLCLTLRDRHASETAAFPFAGLMASLMGPGTTVKWVSETGREADGSHKEEKEEAAREGL